MSQESYLSARQLWMTLRGLKGLSDPAQDRKFLDGLYEELIATARMVAAGFLATADPSSHDPYVMPLQSALDPDGGVFSRTSDPRTHLPALTALFCVFERDIDDIIIRQRVADFVLALDFHDDWLENSFLSWKLREYLSNSVGDREVSTSAELNLLTSARIASINALEKVAEISERIAPHGADKQLIGSILFSLALDDDAPEEVLFAACCALATTGDKYHCLSLLNMLDRRRAQLSDGVVEAIEWAVETLAGNVSGPRPRAAVKDSVPCL